jgi:uncharacterized protein (DUF488 family)
MYYRRKILLSLLQIFGEKLPKIDFQKYLFLFNIKKDDPFFEFIPYKYGCFSFQANQDMSTMIKYNLIEESEKHWHLVDKKNYLGELKMKDKILISNFYRKFNSLKDNELIKYVYEHYPYYAINSRIAEKLLDEEKYKTVISSKPAKNVYTLFTIGYEGKTVERFTNELIKEDIRVLCDIRKNALSMKYGFSKNQLKFIVENVGIKYIHISELGIDSNKRQELNSKEDYMELFRDYENNTLTERSEELEELYKIFIVNKRIALMCFEADHRFCHRSRTVNALIEKYKKDCVINHL